METQKKVDNTKREFMKKFGAYAATAPVGMYMLMTPEASAHTCSSHGTWFGGHKPKHHFGGHKPKHHFGGHKPKHHFGGFKPGKP